MNWNTIFERPRFPAQGEERRRPVFAWLPKVCTNDRTYWLEKVMVYEKFNGSRWLPLMYKVLEKCGKNI
jgi:hypothetical protein